VFGKMWGKKLKILKTFKTFNNKKFNKKRGKNWLAPSLNIQTPPPPPSLSLTLFFFVCFSSTQQQKNYS